jgi:GNAT superfamily N-acetyltransferase
VSETHETTVTVAPVTADRLDDLAALFGTSGTTRGCYCTWFLIPAKESHAGWSGGNRLTFEACARSETMPMGLLAYADNAPVGWCAAGPRSRYTRALRSPVLKQHDPAEDERVWLVPCFFVRVGFRRQGIMRKLLTRAVDLAAAHGATAIEGFPLSGEKRRGSGDAFLGVEGLFAGCGFTAVDRPTANRVVMRLDLSRRKRSTESASSGRTGSADRTRAPRASGATRATTRSRRAQLPSEE